MDAGPTFMLIFSELDDLVYVSIAMYGTKSFLSAASSTEVLFDAAYSDSGVGSS